MSLWPISVAMFSSAPWMTLTVTGSTGRLDRPPEFLPPPFAAPPSPPVPRPLVGVSVMVSPRW